MTALDGEILRTISAVVGRIAAAYEKNGKVLSQDIFAHAKAIESLIIAAAYAGRDVKPVLDILNRKPRAAAQLGRRTKAR